MNPVTARRRAPALVALALAVLATGCAQFASPHKRGERALRRGDFSGAVAAYTDAIAGDEFPVVAYANRCYAYEGLRDRQRALDDCSTALDLLGDDEPASEEETRQRAEILNNRGVALIGLRRYLEAVDDFTAAIALDAEYATAFANRGRAYVELEDYTLAMDDLDKAIEIDPKLPEAYGNRAAAFTGLGDGDRALEEYGAALANGGSPDIYFDRASLHYTMGHFQDALADYIEVTKRSQNEQLVWMAQQQVLFLQNWDGTDSSLPEGGLESTPVGAQDG